MYAYPMPFGKWKGTPLADVPADYLTWAMSAPGCLKGSLRRAVRAELARRGLDAPPEPEAPPPPACKRCGGRALRVYWQQVAGGGRRVRADCTRCLRFVVYLPQTAENVARADAAESRTGALDALTRAEAEGVEIVNQGGRWLQLVPYGRATPGLERLVRQNAHLLMGMLTPVHR